MTEVMDRPSPGLVAPEWLRRQQEQRPASSNVNINDIYWRKPDGYIVVGPSAIHGSDGRPLTAQAEAKMRRGWAPLIEYSYTNRVSSKTGQRETIEVTQDRLGTPDCFYWLFFNGGAHVFPIEQIVESHWHLTPPFYPPGTRAEDVFPQLAEWEVPVAYWCPACPGDRPPKNSEDQVSTHLIISHEMTNVQVTELWEKTDGFKAAPRGSSGLILRRKIVADVAARDTQRQAPSVEAPVARQLNICNNCGERIEGPLASHTCEINLNHDAVAPQPPSVPLMHAPMTLDEVAQAAATPPALITPSGPEVPSPAAGPLASTKKARVRNRPKPRGPAV